MFEHIKYRWRLQKLFNSQTKTKQLFARERKKARRAGKSDRGIEELWAEEGFEMEQIDEEIDALVTEYLCNTARRLRVMGAVWEDEAMWKNLETLARKGLTPKGEMELRSAIRKEQQARRAGLAFWIPIIFGLIGLITGLIAVIKN